MDCRHNQTDKYSNPFFMSIKTLYFSSCKVIVNWPVQFLPMLVSSLNRITPVRDNELVSSWMWTSLYLTHNIELKYKIL